MVKTIQRLLPELCQFDLIVIDPPWRNKYIRRLKRVRQELSYQMLSNEELRNLPISQLIHKHSLVAIWCTNSSQHQTALLEEFLPEWNLQLLHVLKWLKLNINGEPISSISNAGQKQPFEMLFIARHQEADVDFATSIRQVEMLFSVPSIIHSHKPPLYAWLGEYLQNEPKCLEIFARYLQPSFTSIGLEVLKLMDERLYSKT
ncbi:N(6)-adenine-specific methyltransferase METTL4-like [Teleopsis dalmanni]|uniref:N(6)-adenine-specific methyltransferase METTL4-like n=1 Tax=Teleopsis dalmanni TaxID=139649 RepID=UPI0018CCD5F8|nr:N(6)-adenine-specific methyltransferase METTL4-like [Teleopsis dalmanni]XP_037942062.1 N(6)-adenine-specific methyltransferase METTL4-like [Teleopsis dalmanni]